MLCCFPFSIGQLGHGGTGGKQKKPAMVRSLVLNGRCVVDVATAYGLTIVVTGTHITHFLFFFLYSLFLFIIYSLFFTFIVFFSFYLNLSPFFRRTRGSSSCPAGRLAGVSIATSSIREGAIEASEHDLSRSSQPPPIARDQEL